LGSEEYQTGDTGHGPVRPSPNEKFSKNTTVGDHIWLCDNGEGYVARGIITEINWEPCYDSIDNCPGGESKYTIPVKWTWLPVERRFGKFPRSTLSKITTGSKLCDKELEYTG
jgi:hypothetical protein